MKNKTIKVKLPKWAVEKLDYLLESDYCQDRGFEMTYSDLIAEMIANFLNDPQDEDGDPFDEAHTA